MGLLVMAERLSVKWTALEHPW